MMHKIGLLEDTEANKRERLKHRVVKRKDMFVMMIKSRQIFSLKHCDREHCVSGQRDAGTACLWMIACVFMCVGTDGVCGGGG